MRSPRCDPAIGIVPAIAIADVLPAATQQMLRDLSTAAFLQRYLGSARGQPWVILQGPSPGDWHRSGANANRIRHHWAVIPGHDDW